MGGEEMLALLASCGENGRCGGGFRGIARRLLRQASEQIA